MFFVIFASTPHADDMYESVKFNRSVYHTAAAARTSIYDFWKFCGSN